jgi:transcriptional antiterminator RfaH
VHNLEPAWYCLRTHPKHENIAAAHLRQIPGVSVFNPQLQMMRWTRRGRMRWSESLFPNYLFARFILEAALERIRYTAAVKTVLEFGGRTPAIPDLVIEELRQRMHETVSEIFTDAPRMGEEVEITTGPFEGLNGKVAWVHPAKERVKVLLDILGRTVMTELSLDCVLYRKGPLAAATPNHAGSTPEPRRVLNWNTTGQIFAAS